MLVYETGILKSQIFIFDYLDVTRQGISWSGRIRTYMPQVATEPKSACLPFAHTPMKRMVQLTCTALWQYCPVAARRLLTILSGLGWIRTNKAVKRGIYSPLVITIPPANPNNSDAGIRIPVIGTKIRCISPLYDIAINKRK